MISINKWLKPVPHSYVETRMGVPWHHIKFSNCSSLRFASLFMRKTLVGFYIEKMSVDAEKSTSDYKFTK